jgi:hypothetical protein
MVTPLLRLLLTTRDLSSLFGGTHPSISKNPDLVLSSKHVVVLVTCLLRITARTSTVTLTLGKG